MSDQEHGDESSIEVSGVPFKIKFVDHLSYEDEICQGLCEGSEALIELTTKMPDHVQARVLFHELIHAALYVTGNTNALGKGQEEDIVTALEYALWGIMDFRPHIKEEIEWLDWH